MRYILLTTSEMFLPSRSAGFLCDLSTPRGANGRSSSAATGKPSPAGRSFLGIFFSGVFFEGFLNRSECPHVQIHSNASYRHN
jgi:hypothetical protein